ncbi:MAG: pectin esterase, partial [Bacteroidales bacterium]|nr:pectin esterase [Bacteroidales bacterium]
MNRLIIFCLICLSSTWASQAQVFDLTVAKDGSGDFTTIQAAIDSALNRNDQVRTTLFVKAGVYEEKLYIGSHTVSKTNVLSLVGVHRDSVIIRW